MRRVIIESPYAGDVDLNLRYLRAAMTDCLGRGEAPFASHGLYTQPGVLDDLRPDERTLGIKAGFAWRDVADVTLVYADLGVTTGMEAGIDDARVKGREVQFRELGKDWEIEHRRKCPSPTLTPALRSPPAASPPIRSGADLDWQMALNAAEVIVKQCSNAFFAPPEATDIHIMRVYNVCKAMDAIVDALRLRRGHK